MCSPNFLLASSIRRFLSLVQRWRYFSVVLRYTNNHRHPYVWTTVLSDIMYIVYNTSVMVTMLYMVHVYIVYIYMYKMYVMCNYTIHTFIWSILWLFVCMVKLLFLSWSYFPALVCKVPHEFVKGTVRVLELVISCRVARCWSLFVNSIASWASCQPLWTVPNGY